MEQCESNKTTWFGMEKITEVQKMQPMYVSIQQKETGNRIKSLLKQNGYTVKDIQGAMGFENPQAVYKWLSGRSLPSIDNFIILSRLLHTSIEDILVIDGDIVRLWSCYLIFYKNQPFFEKYSPIVNNTFLCKPAV